MNDLPFAVTHCLLLDAVVARSGKVFPKHAMTNSHKRLLRPVDYPLAKLFNAFVNALSCLMRFESLLIGTIWSV